MTYIPRTLIANKLEPDERTIEEDEIAAIRNPLVILGEPGIGKSDLTKSLEKASGGKRVNAGTFSRSENLTPYEVDGTTPLIIDGLDEVSSATGESALDVILKKLDRLGRPRFILSCRAADWQGSPDRWKIEQDYGTRPVTLHIVPFNHQQALRFLANYHSVDGPALLEKISERGLNELVGNPLTLGLLAEVSLEGEGIPENRTKLLDRASRLLVKEANPAHLASSAAQARTEDLLLSAGAVMAHLLISGTLGVSTSSRDNLPLGFVHIADITHLPNAPLTREALETRLFRSEGEGLFVPLHRVIAEYWAAYWLAKRLQNGMSERRLFQALEFGGGVPSPLRGLHAWVGHFCPSVADRCIRSDPYGVLRYGETDELPTPRARLLLSSLATLAKEDPYFRSEDWGTRAVSGLARPELKNEIISVVRSPDRHFHLSSLLLEALPGSTLTKEIALELLELITDRKAAYAERSHAAEALIASGANLDWPKVVAKLTKKGNSHDKRLGLEIIAVLSGKGFTGKQIADAIVAKEGIDRSDRDDDDNIVGTDYTLVHRLSPDQCAEALDAIANRISATARPSYWNPNPNITGTIQRLVAKVLEHSNISAGRFWSWVRFVDARTSYSSDSKEKISNYLKENVVFRREVQRVALTDKRIDGGPWMAIVHEMPQVSAGLCITDEDGAKFIEDVGAKGTLSDEDVTLWSDLVRSMGRPDRYSRATRQAIDQSKDRHPKLEEKWVELTRPPQRDYEKEQRRRQANYRRKQAAKFARHRANFLGVKDQIADGKSAALYDLAQAYLGRYSDLDREAAPIDRLREWVGDEITEAATKGFIATLNRTDLPTLEMVVAIRNEGKNWNIEPVMLCGVAELVRTGQSLDKLAQAVARAVLAVWWDMPEFNSSKLGEDIEKQLEEHVFKSSQSTEEFLVSMIEPPVAAGKDHISGLYRLPRESRFKPLATKLALRWLDAYPQAHQSIQREFLQIALHEGGRSLLAPLVQKRLLELESLTPVAKRMWISAAFLLDLPESGERIAAFATADKSLLWSVRDLLRPDYSDRHSYALTVTQLELIVRVFAPLWPVAARQNSAGWVSGDEPWRATDFIISCINRIGAEPTSEASDALDRLAADPKCIPYLERVKHTRAQQRRLRRDKEYVPPTFDQVRNTLADGTPGTIDDLKALVVDRLDTVQTYLRNADTDGWEAFWVGDKPKDENTCRDRLLDALRSRMLSVVDLIPECLMPEKNRCDIIAIYQGKGVPIEVKGQWHDEVWNASQTQLDDQYGRDWRADGRGIYLVLWFGAAKGKNLRAHPEGQPRPTSPSQLKEMLLARLNDSERARIEVVVLDVSKPPPKPSKKKAIQTKSKRK